MQNCDLTFQCPNITSIEALSTLKLMENTSSVDLGGARLLTDLNGLNNMKQLEKVNIKGCERLMEISGLSASNGVILRWKDDE